MRQSLNEDVLRKIVFLTGSAQIVTEMPDTPAMTPFADEILDFLNEVSRLLMKDIRNRAYSDVITLGFWLRKASTVKLRERFTWQDGDIHLLLQRDGEPENVAPVFVPGSGIDLRRIVQRHPTQLSLFG